MLLISEIVEVSVFKMNALTSFIFNFNDFVSSYYEGSYELLISQAVDRGFANESQELVGVRDENAIGIDLELSNYSDLFLLMSLAVLSFDYSDNAKDIMTYLESMNKSNSLN